MKYIIILCLLPLSVFCRDNTEKHYQEIIAKQLSAQMEVQLPDRTRIDILTKTHAMEIDFADKWAEGIGQSLHYSAMTDLDAGLILIVEKDSDNRYVERVKTLLRKKSLRIKLYVYMASKGILREVP
jgi:CRISPR/Cas system-associated protein Cas10 (large subunit of type III CRISPR-Cas system)